MSSCRHVSCTSLSGGSSQYFQQVFMWVSQYSFHVLAIMAFNLKLGMCMRARASRLPQLHSGFVAWLGGGQIGLLQASTCTAQHMHHPTPGSRLQDPGCKQRAFLWGSTYHLAALVQHQQREGRPIEDRAQQRAACRAYHGRCAQLLAPRALSATLERFELCVQCCFLLSGLRGSQHVLQWAWRKRKEMSETRSVAADAASFSAVL